MAGMAVLHSERLRYAAYALMAAAAVIAYFWLDSDPDQLPIEAARRAISSEDFPILQTLDTEVEQEGRRDLFAFGRGEPAVETTLPSSSLTVDQPDPAPEKSDLLANVQAMGVVRRNDSVTVLVRVGTRLLTVGLGEPFGEGDALRVGSIEGRNVQIVDSNSGSSRSSLLVRVARTPKRADWEKGRRSRAAAEQAALPCPILPIGEGKPHYAACCAFQDRPSRA